MSWKARPSAQPNAAVAGDDVLVLGREDGARLDRGGDEGRGLAPDHVEVEVDAHQLVRRAHRDVEVLALAQREAGLVEEAHQAQDGPVREAEVGQAVEGDPRQAEQRVAGVDRLRDAVDRPERRAVAALDVAVLDVVVDEAEVVAELDGGRAGQRALVLAGDAGVGQQAEERPHPLAAGRARAVEREVVADHLVQPVGRRIAVADEADDLALRVGDERGEVDIGRGGRHRRAECTRNVYGAGSLIGRRAPRHDEDDAGAGDAIRTGVYRRYVGSAPDRITLRSRPRPRAGGTVAADAHPAPLHDRCDRPVAVRSRRGRPRPDPHHPDRRQAQGDRQGHPAADLAAGRQPRAVRRADRRRWRAAGRSTS